MHWLEFMLDRYDGLIIESFGVGGLPEYDGGHLYDVVRRGVERGKLVVMTTQVPNEGSDLTVYHVGGTPEEHPPAAGGLRHDHRGRRGQAHVDHGADP